jgi:hypothetical protein
MYGEKFDASKIYNLFEIDNETNGASAVYYPSSGKEPAKLQLEIGIHDFKIDFERLNITNTIDALPYEFRKSAEAAELNLQLVDLWIKELQSKGYKMKSDDKGKPTIYLSDGDVLLAPIDTQVTEQTEPKISKDIEEAYQAVLRKNKALRAYFIPDAERAL